MLDVEEIVLREIRLPLVEPFQSASGTMTERRIFLVQLIDKDGRIAWGECVGGDDLLSRRSVEDFTRVAQCFAQDSPYGNSAGLIDFSTHFPSHPGRCQRRSKRCFAFQPRRRSAFVGGY